MSEISMPAVVLLVFNRPEHTKRMLDQVRLAKPPMVLVVADGPRPQVAEDVSACAEVRSIIEKGTDWGATLKVNYAETNLGLRKRVSSGLNWAFGLVEEAIVVEDDCVVSPAFFRFCAELLDRYRDEPRIAVVSGDNFQPQPFACAASYYFSKYPHCWGWGTWRRAWNFFDESMSQWPALRDSGWLKTLFHDPGHIAYWTQHFDKVHRREMNSWALPWTFSCWSQSMLSILPKVNLVRNIGFGSQSTHTPTDKDGLWNPAVRELEFPLQHPNSMILNQSADDYTQEMIYGTVPAEDAGSLAAPIVTPSVTSALALKPGSGQSKAGTGVYGKLKQWFKCR